MRHDHNRIRRSEYTHLPYTTRAAAVHASGDVIARRTRRYLSVQERVAVLTQSSAAQRTGDEVILNIRSPTGKEDKELKDSSSGMHPTAIISVIAARWLVLLRWLIMVAPNFCPTFWINFGVTSQAPRAGSAHQPVKGPAYRHS
jgi:hypothetical protein